MTIDELELVRRAGHVDPLPHEVTERAEVLLRAAMAVPEAATAGARAVAGAHGVEVRRRRWRTTSTVAASAVAASVLALSGVAVGWEAVHGSGHAVATGRRTAPKMTTTVPKLTLTAMDVRLIAARSVAAASTGTAEVTQTSSMNGEAQAGYTTAVTFSGQNIDEQITSVPEPPGSSKSFTTDDRYVDGQFYIYTPGPNDVAEWLHDTNSAGDAPAMQFPDPRTLYSAISPSAQFAADGTTTMNGETVTHLVADDPSAISDPALESLAPQGTLTSFAIWVDREDVVQQIAFSTSSTGRVCQFKPLGSAGAQDRGSKTDNVLNAPAGKATAACGSETTTTNTTITFADLGIPQSVTAPVGAVDFSGKG